MIVRDEAQVIGRCLDSVRGFADSYVIVDTGSADNTRELVQLHELPGQLHHRPWVNFGHNRTELMALARGKADWLLLLDADMTLEHERYRLFLDDVDDDIDAFMIRFPGDPEYWLKCLIRGDKQWRSVGAAHEYLAGENGRHGRLHGLTIRHHGDGGHRAEKFERDLQLLRAELDEDAGNARAQFYYANTLRDLGRGEEAIDAYLRRAKMGGWDEERFCALLEAGRLSGDPDILFEAWSARPHRAEPLYELSWRFRRRRQWAAAQMVAERGASMSLPDDILFVNRWVYEWGCLFELSIAAFYAGAIEEARDCHERLLACETLPGAYRDQVVRNGEWLSPEPAAGRR